MTYQVRVDLAGTAPPTWRRLEVASGVFLDDLHEIIQIAFGWTDSHLHRFGCGPVYYSDDAEYYLMDFEVGSGEMGIPEQQVRLDEVLADIGDRMFYCYDFGDNWQLVLRLEAVEPQVSSARNVVCTHGDRDGSAEDCGGLGAYELIEAFKDPTIGDPGTEIEYRQVLGDIDPYSYPTTPFDIAKINKALCDFDRHVDIGQLPDPLADLLGAVRTTSQRRLLRRMMGVAMQEPVPHRPGCRHDRGATVRVADRQGGGRRNHADDRRLLPAGPRRGRVHRTRPRRRLDRDGQPRATHDPSTASAGIRTANGPAAKSPSAPHGDRAGQGRAQRPVGAAQIDAALAADPQPAVVLGQQRARGAETARRQPRRQRGVDRVL
ncbi:MAG: hypothetical protein B7W97_00870, partial [Mycobacterium sp. 20-66-4]